MQNLTGQCHLKDLLGLSNSEEQTLPKLADHLRRLPRTRFASRHILDGYLSEMVFVQPLFWSFNPAKKVQHVIEKTQGLVLFFLEFSLSLLQFFLIVAETAVVDFGRIFRRGTVDWFVAFHIKPYAVGLIWKANFTVFCSGQPYGLTPNKLYFVIASASVTVPHLMAR